MSPIKTVAIIAFGVFTTSCVSYSSIQKADNHIYLSGMTSYWVMSVPFLKRCDVEGQILRCEELKEFETSKRINKTSEKPAPVASTGDSSEAAK